MLKHSIIIRSGGNIVKNYKFFSERDSKVYFEGNYMEVYIPNYYFKEEIAETVGSSIKTLGIFHFGVFQNAEKTNPEDGTIYTLNMPLDIVINFSNMSKEKRKVKKEIGEEEYTILSLNKGDVFIEQTKLIKGIEAVEKFASKLLHGGKLPKSIKYEDVIKLYHKCLDFNGIGLGVPSLTLESIVSEIYRDRNDVSQPFRKRIGKGGSVSQYAYEPYNIKKIPSLSSTFAALTFEDMNQSIIDSIKRNRDGKQEMESPVEKTIRY
jgi:hypothetical protein